MDILAEPGGILDAPAKPDNTETLSDLVREIQMSQGSALMFALCNRISDRSRLIAGAKEALSGKNVQEISIRREVDSLLYVLRANVEEPLPDAIFVYGMEQWLGSDKNPRSVPFILNLDAGRNHLVTEFPCPIVFWIPEYILALITKGATHFISGRSGVYEFASSPVKPDLQMPPSTDDWEYGNLSIEQRQKQREELSNLLHLMESLPPEQQRQSDIAHVLNELAELLYFEGDYPNALPHYQRALAIREKVLGPEHPDTAASLNNLAVLYWQQGDYPNALPHYQRALAIREKVLGPEHPDTAASLNNLAYLYQQQGKYTNALPLHQRALAIREKVLGPEHPDTAQSLNNLANLYDSIGDYPNALRLHQRALAIWEKVLGPEHPDTATSLNNLANLYRQQGDYAQSLPLYQRAVSILTKVLGEKHPNTQTVIQNYNRCQKEIA